MNAKKRAELLRLFDDLRVCDVRDAMDAMGYFHYGSLDQNVRPLWRTRAYGLARTVRYLPYLGPEPRLSAEEYRREWTAMYYREICPYPWADEIEDGDFCGLPVMFDTKKAKVLYTEASLHNYPIILIR